MEHIVQIAVSVDDERIKALCEEAASRQITQSIIECANGKDRWTGKVNTNPDNLKDIFREEISKYIKENSDGIIKEAIKELTYNMTKTKVVKEALINCIKEN